MMMVVGILVMLLLSYMMTSGSVRLRLLFLRHLLLLNLRLLLLMISLKRVKLL